MGQALLAKALSYAYLGFFEKALKINKDAEVICSKIKDNDEFIALWDKFMLVEQKSSICNINHLKRYWLLN